MTHILTTISASVANGASRIHSAASKVTTSFASGCKEICNRLSYKEKHVDARVFRHTMTRAACESRASHASSAAKKTSAAFARGFRSVRNALGDSKAAHTIGVAYHNVVHFRHSVEPTLIKHSQLDERMG